MAGDDREEFRQEKRRHASEMAADRELAEAATALYAGADRHNWSYQWTWLGVPIIQIPTDIVASQELVWATRPQLIIETGVARGGSIVFWASMLELIGEGTVLGIDIDIRPHNREAVESHPLAGRVALFEGSSIGDEAIAAATEAASGVERVMVVLDSNHTHEHVLAELEAYGPLVTPGQYLVVSDTIVEHIPAQDHRPRPWGPGDNPATAVDAYLAAHGEFSRDEELTAKLLLTSSPGGYLRRS